MNEPIVQYSIEGWELEAYRAPSSQLLKWIGNKQRFAESITSFFPRSLNKYIEPFLGSGAVLATIEPTKGIGADAFKPLIEIWATLKSEPDNLIAWYTDRWDQIGLSSKQEVYNRVLSSYNINPNGADFLFLTRSCYGGVVRFRKSDGYMSTPCGIHDPIPPSSFRKRVWEWHKRVKNTDFYHLDYQDTFDMARPGDMIYCDPPYSYSQGILYGAQDFNLLRLLEKIDEAKSKGINVALSIDGNKKSGNILCDLPIPSGLFARELSVNCGRSMLKRFQMEGKTLEGDVVNDRLLLTY